MLFYKQEMRIFKLWMWKEA